MGFEKMMKSTIFESIMLTESRIEDSGTEKEIEKVYTKSLKKLNNDQSDVKRNLPCPSSTLVESDELFPEIATKQLKHTVKNGPSEFGMMSNQQLQDSLNQINNHNIKIHPKNEVNKPQPFSRRIETKKETPI